MTELPSETNESDQTAKNKKKPLEDRLLGFILTLAEATDGADGQFEMAITLTVPGAVISGTLVSSNAWRETALNGSGPGARETLDMMFKAMDDAGGDSSWFESDVVHLIGARILSGAALVPANGSGAPWRCDARQVSSWTFNRMS